ncbi:MULTISPECIES: murein hydrolase activator EnvC family protein [unclassified Helicobacter]|uniref:murein hydrolase activator EnvC family protein n=1 Tax=unclassified Helicobacter TaxID=2593540 RepID=UPI000CF1B372|nr:MULTISPECIES: peptidoglycan DD-metalloendopeptidase family protein [unclassified Helicobacter]
MKKNFFLLFLCCIFCYSADLKQINKDINLNQKKIQKKESEKNEITNIIQKLGNKINQTKQKINNYDKKIQEIQKLITSNQSENSNQEQALENYQAILLSLQKEKQEIREKITKILINDASFVIILNHENPVSPDDIMLQEIFKLLNKNSQEKIQLLTQKEKVLETKIAQTMQNITKISQNITTQENQKKYLQTMLKEQKKLIKDMQKDIKNYNTRLAQIEEERKSLDKILSNLNILRQKTQKELDEEKRLAMERKKQETNKNQSREVTEVKQVANSYRALSIAKYSGPKTIAPIEKYTVEQKFGTYFDPVYKLKVFNESVILVSKVPNTPVKSIFDGKIVYAKEVPILKKVIIIENQNGIHTIYSQLDKIAPTIKVGLRIQKGYIIGRVNQKLSFEITQKDKHIDPLEVIVKSK